MSETYLAQYRDWSGEWCDDGVAYGTAVEARDVCIGHLNAHGYPGADVRVLRVRSDRTCEVVLPIPAVGSGEVHGQ